MPSHSLRIPLLVLLACTVTAAGCNFTAESFGTLLTYGKGQLYYTDRVTEAEARRLGALLYEQDYFDDQSERAVQLTKEGGTYQVRMVVVLDSLKAHPEVEATFPQMTSIFSKKAFDGSPTEIHLCDDRLETFRIVPFSPTSSSTTSKYGDRLSFLKGELFYTDSITEAEARLVGERLVALNLFSDLKETSIQLTKHDETYQLRMPYSIEVLQAKPQYRESFRAMTADISQVVLAGAPVEFHLCDSALVTHTVIPFDPGASTEILYGPPNPAWGTRIIAAGDVFYHTRDVGRATAEKVIAYFKEKGQLDGRGIVMQLGRSGGTWQLRMIAEESLVNDAEVISEAESTAAAMSSTLFNNAPTEIHLTDDSLRTLRVVSTVK